MEVKIKKLNGNAVIPTRGSEKSAGYDLYACMENSVFVKPHETVVIGTGLSMELPDNTFGAIFARSSFASERGLAPANKVGICDSDYRGEYKIAIHNHSDRTQWVDPGERIAQLIVIPYFDVDFYEVDKLGDTERGAGGFGSTGA